MCYDDDNEKRERGTHPIVEDAMQYRTLPKLGIEVSAFGVGCMRFPMIETPEGKKVDVENAKRIIRTAIDQGVNYVDTAYVYSGKTNESVVGECLADGYRDKVYLATKLPTIHCKEPADMERIFEEQLRNLRTDHIDFYLLHAMSAERWEHAKSLGVKEFLNRLKAEGKIRYACFSFHDEYEAFEKIITDYDWDMCQIQYNYFDAAGNRPGVKGLRLAEKLGIPVVIMEGLLGGKLANVPAEVREVLETYPERRSPVEWAFRWLCNDPAVGTVLSGVLDTEMTKQNVRIFDRSGIGVMSAEELALVERAREALEKRIKVGCTGCKYCMPCPAGVDIPGVFEAINTAYRFNDFKEGKEDYAWLKKKECAADRCVKCGKCEGLCPQHLPIRDLLAETDRELKG